MTDAVTHGPWLGIDFSGDPAMWTPGCGRSNVWIAEIRRSPDTDGRFVLSDLKRVQQLPGQDQAFLRLGRLLAQRKFAAAGIDAPFSLPARFVTFEGHPALLANVYSLEHSGRPFATGKAFVELVAQTAVLDQKKPLRVTEREWSDRGVNIRSTLWAGPRGGAPMTAACFKLLHLSGCPLWPWSPDGQGILVEAFPAGQLKQWDLPSQQYSKNIKIHIENREKIVDGLESRMDLQGWRETLLATADAIDAAVCALTAAAVTLNRLAKSPDVNVSDREGWIAISK